MHVTDQRLGARLAEGACAEVFEWGGDGTAIVKLAKPNTNLFALQRERRLCHIAWELGLPVPRPHELVEVDGRNGIVFDRVAGTSILQRFAAGTSPQDQWPDKWHDAEDPLHARLTARMLHAIHSYTASDLPPQQASVARDIRRSPHLTDAEKDAVVAQFDRLPRRFQLCHGDPNPGNLILTADAVVVIDWNNATVGNPEADLAEYILMLRYATLPAGTPADLIGRFEAIRASSIHLFTAEYERLSGLGPTRIAPWLTPIAARKLAVDSISDAERDGLIGEVRRGLGV